MINRPKLLTDLQVLLRKLEADLLERSSAVSEVGETLQLGYQQAKEAERSNCSNRKHSLDRAVHVAISNGLIQSKSVCRKNLSRGS